MTEKKSQKKIYPSVKTLSRNIVLIFILSIFVMDIMLTNVISYYASKTMNEKISMLMSANTYQQAMNVESYFEDIKDTSSLFFSDEIYYTYDPTQAASDLEKLESENVIIDRINNLGVLENFSDFGFVYSDTTKFGWFSEGIYKVVSGSDMYKFFSSCITDENTESGWLCSEKNNYNKIYYVKRINKNGLVIASFYTRELDSIFNIPPELESMDMRLVNENDLVIYSTNNDELGKPLNADIAKLASGSSSASNSDYIVSSLNFSTNSWRIICSLPEDFIKADTAKLVWFAHAFAFAIMLIVSIVGYFAITKASNPVSELVSSLSEKAEHDLLTGVLNKISFRTMTETIMEKAPEKSIISFVMLDMDNFKQVNDTFGHKVGDEILVSFAKLLRDTIGSDCIVGRLGGDEFALFNIRQNISSDVVVTLVERQLEYLRNCFIKQFNEYNESCGLSLSAGAYISPSDNKQNDFNTIYGIADAALYTSKRNGKNTYTVTKG